MILPLRQRHRRMMIVLGIFVPVTFIAGLAARRPVPVMESLPANLSIPVARFADAGAALPGLFVKTPVQVRLHRRQPEADGFDIELSAPPDFIKPDLFVYWCAAPPAVVDELPGDAVLLGAFNPAAPLPLPRTAASGGVLILYSLADAEVVDISKPLTF
jgi:hypothetical protein